MAFQNLALIDRAATRGSPLPFHPHADKVVPIAASPLWRIENLHVRYGTHQVLRSISLDIAMKRVTAIIGPSGCGKSTFLSCLNLLIRHYEDAVVSGSIDLEGTDILAGPIDLHVLRQKVGFVFQKPNPFPLSIWRNLELPLREHGCRDSHEIAAKIEQALGSVGLWKEVKDRLRKPAQSLSGGQQQRLCLARALILNPTAILMDEPCSALDPMATALIEELIQSLRGDYTIVIVTHNLRQAKRIGDEVALFWCTDDCVGYLAESGSAEEVFSAPREEVTRRYLSGTIS